MQQIDLDEEFGPELPEKVEVINFPENEKIGGLISDLKKAVEGIETKVNVTVGTEELAEVVKSLEAWQITTVDAINAIPQPIEPKDYTKNLEEIKKALKKEIDFTPVVSALAQFESKERKVEVSGLAELKTAIASIGEKIDNIQGFEIPERLIYKDHLKVTPDRVGGGGGGLTVAQGEYLQQIAENTDDLEVNTDALEAKQDTLISLVETLQELNARLMVLSGMANAGAPALRVIPIASVSTAVTGTVTATVASTSITNFGTGAPAKEVADDINNMMVTLANINNASAA